MSGIIKTVSYEASGTKNLVEKLKEQPRWTWFMNWGDPGRMRGDFKSFIETYTCEEVLTLDELPWVKIS